MPSMVPLPEGQHALLRDPDQVTERQRRPFERAQIRMGLFANRVPAELDEKEHDRQLALLVMAEDPDLLDEIGEMLIMALLASWSYDLPVCRDSLLDIPGPAYRQLKDACTELRAKLMVSFEYPRDNDDKTLPTGP